MSHASERAIDRYGLHLTNAEMASAYDAIKRRLPSAILLNGERYGGYLYAIRFHGEWLAAIWKDGRIVTFLGRDKLTPYLYRLPESLTGDPVRGSQAS